MYQFTFSTDDPRLLARILELVTPTTPADAPAEWPLTAIAAGWTPPAPEALPTPCAVFPPIDLSEEGARALQKAYCEKFGLVKFRDAVYAAGVKRLSDLDGDERGSFFARCWAEIQTA